MRQEFRFDSCGSGKIHGYRWIPEGTPKAVIQIVHGIAEHSLRYDEFARFLNTEGFVVVSEDHMGHGQSVGEDGIQGYFHGGWHAAVRDTYRLTLMTRRKWPGIPYILFGHSMGSFMARTILCDHPDGPIDAAIISGTGWQDRTVLGFGAALCSVVCRDGKDKLPNERLHQLIFGGYNAKVEHPRTDHDWLSRDKQRVDAFMDDPKCGFVATAGLMQDLLSGLIYIQDGAKIRRMRKDLPVYFIAGTDDPVGNYGKGVEKTVQAFRKAGMEKVEQKLYPLCRHELINEINRQEVFADLSAWIGKVI